MVEPPEEQPENGRLLEALAGLPHREELVPAGQLEVDHTYQRQRVREDWVKQIAEHFDPDLFEPLRVNRRRRDGGRLFVMDGQHRHRAILRLWGPETLVPCLVYDDLPYETEAKHFDTQGYSRPPTQQERFKSALSRREPDEVTVDGIVRRSGFQLNLSHSDMTEGRIPAVQALKKILHKHRSGVLTDVLEACRDGFGTDLGPRAPVLAGLATFISRYRNERNYDPRRLVTALKTMTANGLYVEGFEMSRAQRIPIEDVIAFKVLEAYNYRMQENRRLPAWAFGKARKKTR